LALLMALSLTAGASDLADEADLHFQLGAKRYQAGDFNGALEHFLRSNRLVPNKNVLFNIARCYEQLGQYPNAWRFYSTSLDTETDAKQKAAIQDSLNRIAPNVAVIRVESDPPDATIYVDRKDLGPRGSAPRDLGLAPGKYTIILERPGYEAAQSQVLTVTAGSKTSVKLKLKSIFGKLRVEGAAGAEIRIDDPNGPVAGKAPVEIAVEPGPRRVFVTKPGTRAAELDVDIAPNKTSVIRPRLVMETGTLVVATDLRDALIEVDGEPKGFTPAVVTIPVGAHSIRVSLSGFRPIERKVKINANKQATLNLELAREAQVSAVSRTTQLVEEAPSSVSIITGQELRAMGYPTIAEAVRGVRGVYLTDDRSYVTLGFRGFSRPGDYGNKILILYDGHPFNDNILYQSFPGFEGRTDIEDVQRIEVVRGPGSALYGTGAVFGVVNVVTHERDQPSKVEVGASAVEHSMLRGRAHAYHRFGRDAGVWLSAAGARGAGRDFHFPEYQSDPSGLNGEARGLDDSTLATFQGRAWYRDLTLQWMWHQREKTLPHAEYETLFGDPRNQFVDKRGFVEARFEPKLSEQFQSLTRAHANLYTFESGSPYAPADGGLAKEKYVGQWAGLEQRFVIQPSKPLRFTLGGEAQRHFRASLRGEDDAGVFLPDDKNPFWVMSAYGVGDVEVSQALALHAGVRYDYFKWEFTSLPETSKGSLNPRAAVVAKPYAGGVTKLMGGSAFRAPTVYELFYQSSVQRPSPSLEPETVYSGELEHTHSITRAVHATGAVYANYVDNLIVGRGSGTAADPLYLANSSAPVLVLGGEVELRRDWREGWMVAAQYSLSRARYVKNDADLRKVPNSPTHLASVKGAVPIIGRSLSVMNRVTLDGSRYDRLETTTDPAQGKTDAGVVWDVVFSGDMMGSKVRYAVGAYNVADWHYSAPVSGEFRMTTIPQPGRTFLASMNMEL